MFRVPVRLTQIAGLLFILAACSAGAQPTATSSAQPSPSPEMPMASDDHDDGFAWGEPAEAGEADRVIEIAMLDTFRFDPASVEVHVGETITFRVTNDGVLEHDFTLGDSHTQDEHDAEMAMGGMSGGHDEPNVLTVAAGEHGELTWHFTAPASILYGCHVPGHYPSGMVGTLTISET